MMTSVLRPFLEKWQVRFRHWWKYEGNPELSPLEKQNEFPNRDEFLSEWADLRAVMRALEKTSPELCADIHTNGIYLTGGGALIRGLDKLIEEQTGLKVYVPPDPLLSVVKGAAAVLKDFENMKKVCVN